MRYLPLTIFLIAGCEPLPVPILNDPNGYLQTAASYMMYNEHKNRKELKQFLNVDPVATEWCAAFVNSTLNANGFEGSESISEYPLMARSFLEYGETADSPEVGDIIVLSRGKGWQGHVGFFISEIQNNGITYYALLSGNNNDTVNIDWFDKRRVLGIRRVTFANLLESPVKNLPERTPTDQQSLLLVQAYLFPHTLLD